MPAFAFEIENAIDHMFYHTRPGDLAFLGDMAHKHHSGARLLGIADQRLRGGTHLRHGSRCGIRHVGPQRLDRIDDDEIGPFGV